MALMIVDLATDTVEANGFTSFRDTITEANTDTWTFV